MSFLWQFTRKKAKWLRDGFWRQMTKKSPTGSGDTDNPDMCGQETGRSGGVGGPIQGDGDPRGDRAAALLLLVQNAHVSGQAKNAQE